MAFEPMLFVDDVEATSRFLQGLLGLKSAHGGKEYEIATKNTGAVGSAADGARRCASSARSRLASLRAATLINGAPAARLSRSESPA